MIEEINKYIQENDIQPAPLPEGAEIHNPNLWTELELAVDLTVTKTGAVTMLLPSGKKLVFPDQGRKIWGEAYNQALKENAQFVEEHYKIPNP